MMCLRLAVKLFYQIEKIIEINLMKNVGSAMFTFNRRGMEDIGRRST